MLKRIKGRWGDISYLDNDLLGKYIENYGEFSPEESSYLLSLAEEASGCLLDVGAHIGCMTQVFMSTGKEVHSFEPQPEIFKILKENTSDNVTAHNFAAYDTSCKLNMPLTDINDSEINTAIASVCEGGRGLIVEAKTIDSLRLPKVGLVKLDVEGSELLALKGMQKTIERDKPIIYLEGDRLDKLPDLAEFMDSIGYNYTPRDFPYFSEDNFLGNTKNFRDQDYITLNWECRYVNNK